MPALYPDLLGAAFNDLAPAVQRLHAASTRARGRFRVRRGDGAAARGLAALLAMPDAADAAPVSLEIARDGDRERWIRTIGGRVMRSEQWRDGDLLAESMGPITCWFRLLVEGGALVMRQVRAAPRGGPLAVPLPPWLAPQAEGRAGGDGEAVRVDVSIRAPLAGLILSYEGTIIPEKTA